jgi:hypothetical protein
MTARPSISITLSPAQVDAVVRAASHGLAPTVSGLVADSLHPRGRRRDGDDDAGRVGNGRPQLDTRDPRMSRSLLRGLSILTCFGSDEHERGIVELATQLGMSPSTAHRYALTLVEVGLLERCPRTRKYRLPET